MKILVAVPSMDTVPTQFCSSLALLRKPQESEVAIAFQVGSLVYSSRNELSKKAIQMGVDWILWLDSDMVFNSDTLIKMMDICEEKSLDILSGLYFRRVSPFSPVLYKSLNITDEGCDWAEFTEIPTELFKADGIGFGCVLMKSDVLMDVAGKFGNLFAPIKGVGEDLSFCWRARECGYEIYCDPSIELGHVGHTIITRQVWDTLKGQKANDNNK